MERISARSLIDQPVRYASQTVGNIKRIWFNLDTGTVIGFVIQPVKGKRSRLLLRPQLNTRDDGWQISNREDLTLPVRRSRGDQVIKATRHILDGEAVTEDGRVFGRVNDLTISLPDWSICQVIVAEAGGERLIDRKLISRMQDDRVIFINEVLDGTRPWVSTGLPTQATT